MNKKNLLKKLANVANDLDSIGFKKEANILDNIFKKVAQVQGPTSPIDSNPFIQSLQNPLESIQNNNNALLKGQSDLAERQKNNQLNTKPADLDLMQSYINWAASKNFTVDILYQQALKDKGPNFANNIAILLESKGFQKNSPIPQGDGQPSVYQT